MNSDGTRDYQAKTKAREDVCIICLKKETKKWSTFSHVKHNVYSIIQSLVRTCPDVKVFPSYSMGSNGLPLAKIARPWKLKKSSMGYFYSTRGKNNARILSVPTFIVPHELFWLNLQANHHNFWIYSGKSVLTLSYNVGNKQTLIFDRI